MSPFIHVRELTRPEDVRELLADPETQWRKGFSAHELATSWMSAWGSARFHTYIDPEKNKREVYVSYGLVRDNGRWKIAEAGSSTTPIRQHEE